MHKGIVYWSKEDNCYVGRCPSLFFGGVHGKNEKRVQAHLERVIRDWETPVKQPRRTRHKRATKRYATNAR